MEGAYTVFLYMLKYVLGVQEAHDEEVVRGRRPF